MIVASIVHRKVFNSIEYLCAFAVCAGLVFFAAADWELAPTFNPIGLVFVTLSVCADAILPNAQEGLFRTGSSRLEVTVYTNVYTLIAMTVTTLISGDLIGFIQFARTSHTLVLYMSVYTFIAYLAISAHMTVVKRFGGVAAVVLATGRKGMTLVLSFVLFPKAFSWFYVLGASMVLGGLLLSSLHKIYSRKRETMKRRESLEIVNGTGTDEPNDDVESSDKQNGESPIQITDMSERDELLKPENGTGLLGYRHVHQN
jgi:adenosine 3'-phospho 5'-phosphosulfate transporter B3